MKMFIPIMTILFVVLLGAAANSLTCPIPPIPDWPESSWDVGNSVSYKVSVQQGTDEASCNLRIAVLGTEVEADTRLYRVEFDLTSINLPTRWNQELISGFGEAPNAFHLNMLIPYYDLVNAIADPSQFYYIFSEPGFIRGLLFQYNDQTPYDVDPTLIGGFMLPLIASSFLGENIPEDFMSSRNLGLQLVEDPQYYTTENSSSEITVDAGSFRGHLFTYTAASVDGETGTIFYSSETPILPFVMSTINWIDGSSTAHIEVELIDVKTSGASTQIVGDPIRFDLQTLMYYGM